MKCTRVTHVFSLILSIIAMLAIIFLAITVLSKIIDSMTPRSIAHFFFWFLRAFIGVIGFFGCAIAIVVMSKDDGSNIFSRQVAKKNVLLKNGKVERVLDNDEYFWHWELKDYEIFCPNLPEVKMHAQPITVNPKVRKIDYTIETKLIDMQKYYDFTKNEKHSSHLFVKENLYDFNEQHSKELAELFNPLKDDQQKKFAILVGSYLNPHLEKIGLGVAKATFKLN